MIVLHPYLHSHPEIVSKIAAAWPSPVMLPVTGRYEPWDTVKSLWGTDDLVIIEEHKEIHDAVIPQFLSCPSPWCLFPFELINKGNFCYDGIGCVRFRREMQLKVTAQDVEDAYRACWECWAVPGVYDKPARPGCWRHLDGAVKSALELRGYDRCIHEPPVRHWEVYHGCEV